MKLKSLVLAAILAVGALALLVPSAGAVDVCTSATGHCDGYLVCYGATRGPGGYVEDCRYGVAWQPCDPGPCRPDA